MKSWKWVFLAGSLALMACQKERALETGKYAVNDPEYREDHYDLHREFQADGSFSEAHSLSNCVMMEMKGRWEQNDSELRLHYASSRQRKKCSQEFSGFVADSGQLVIPIRHVQKGSFESFLTASGGKPEKWLLWNREGV